MIGDEFAKENQRFFFSFLEKKPFFLIFAYLCKQ